MIKVLPFFTWLLLPLLAAADEGDLPPGFVYLDQLAPSIVVELRYAGKDNFVGSKIRGYEGTRCVLSSSAAKQLKKAQDELRTLGLSLKVFDAYRPQRSVDHFVAWAKDLPDEKMKSKFYPSVEKADLFRKGYIAAKSGHSRGSTVDVTIVDAASHSELDMGAAWDFFDPISWSTSTKPTAQQRANRLLLRSLMIRHGFRPLKEEWWHFTLEDEPFPDHYFDFVIK